MQDVADIVICAVAVVEPIVRHLEPGFYLHGSAASHSMTATSDVHVRVLCGSEVTANQRG